MLNKILLFVLSTLGCYDMIAQGCSDAGVCSAGNSLLMDTTTSKHQIQLGAVYGIGFEDLVYLSPYLSYTRRFGEKLSINTRVNFQYAKGSFGSILDAGDVLVIGNLKQLDTNSRTWSVLFGLKAPLTQSNSKINNYSLPLDYQSSLGTFDVIVGTEFKYLNWSFNTAIQLPVVNLNRNSFIDEYSASNDFPTTNLFRRKPDYLLRAAYTIHTKMEKFTFKPNLLFLYHLGNDSYENIFGIREEISNSEGVTLNANLIANYKIKSSSSLELSIASPLIARQIRPDGLTRKLTVGLVYGYSF